MVYCTRCGVEIPDDSRHCSQCGASLYTVGEEHVRRPETECFGIENIPRAGAIVGLVFGLLIICAGVLWLLKLARIIPLWIELGPFAVMIFGILVVVGAVYGMRDRQ